jgi:hypothetical protein
LLLEYNESLKQLNYAKARAGLALGLPFRRCEFKKCSWEVDVYGRLRKVRLKKYVGRFDSKSPRHVVDIRRLAITRLLIQSQETFLHSQAPVNLLCRHGLSQSSLLGPTLSSVAVLALFKCFNPPLLLLP